jgi:hypothetical protein
MGFISKHSTPQRIFLQSQIIQNEYMDAFTKALSAGKLIQEIHLVDCNI